MTVKDANVCHVTGRVEIVRHPSRLLDGNPLGDPTERELGIYLPPSYDADPARRFPTVLFLPGFTGTGLALVNRGGWTAPLDRRMDALIASERAAEAILILPDCFTRYGGSQYVDSPAIGPYQSYLCDEILPFVDARYRTTPRRGVIGKSSGGYGALLLAMRRPDLFCAAASHAGDCAFDLSYRRELGHTVMALERRGGVKGFLAWFETQVQKPGSAIEVMSNLCCAAAWSPSATGPYGFGEGFELPMDLRTGALRSEIWAQWLAQDPLNLLEPHADALRSLSALFVDAGLGDEYNLQLGARLLCDKLGQLGIAHLHEEFDGGHMSTAHRYDRSLEIVTRALADK